MTEPRGHHLVAQLYQRGFARKAGKSWQVRVVNRGNGEAGLRNVRNAFKRRDWNTFIDADGQPDFSVEQILAERVDSPAAPALATLREGTFPAAADLQIVLSVFMAAQLVRGREFRENLSGFLAKTNSRMVQLAAQNYTDAKWEEVVGFVPTGEEIELLAENDKHVDMPPTAALLLEGLLSSVDDIADLLGKRTWTLVSFEKPCLFTGEHPFVHVLGSEGSYGVATAEQLHLPVSPTRTLVLSHPWSSWPEGHVRGTTELASRLNWATFTHPANGELLMHPDVRQHPLPSVGLLDRGGLSWPWGEDPDSKPPPSLDLILAAKARRGEVVALAA